MDPEFLAGSEHVAHCPVTNPTGKQWTYDAELYLVKDDTKYASSGTVSFTLAAGASDTIDFPIMMPDTSGTYKVYLDVYVSGELIAAYQATEDVTVVPVPGVWYILVYTGESQPSVDAFASIADYLCPDMAVWRWDAPTQAYVGIKTLPEIPGEDTMIPYACYQFCVTQACEWTYGPEATPPTEVQLYTGHNFIPYCGEPMAASDALASIMSYISVIYHWNAETQSFDAVGADTILQPDTCYSIGVTQDCTWVFGAPSPPEFELIEDPKVTFRALSLPGGLIATDFFTGAELSVHVSATYYAAVTFKSEYCLIKDGEAIPIGSHSMTLTGGISSVSWYITLPNEPGTYETMLRIYTNGVLTGQYPYLGPITVVPKGVSNFSYTKPYLRVWWDSDWPGYRFSVESTITNTGNSAEQRQVVLWLREYLGPLSGRNQWRRMDEITLGLAPGGSHDYSYSGILGMVGDSKFIAQLRDSDGGVSEKSNAVTAT